MCHTEKLLRSFAFDCIFDMKVGKIVQNGKVGVIFVLPANFVAFNCNKIRLNCLNHCQNDETSIVFFLLVWKISYKCFIIYLAMRNRKQIPHLKYWIRAVSFDVDVSNIHNTRAVYNCL